MRIRDWSSDVCSSDLSRGDVIVTADAPTEVADQFESTIVWMDEDEMLPGRPYLLKTGTSMVTATITKPKYEVNVNTIVHEAAETLSLRSEEHTSELQSLMRISYAVFCLKKKNNISISY